MLMRICFIIFLTAGLLTACADTQGIGEPDQSSPVIVLPVPAGETAVVDSVIDGDTIEVSASGNTYRVRYIGVDTPERGEAFYREATQANQLLVSDQEIILVRDVSETDQYGRLLRYIYLSDGTFVNAELLRLGFAQLVTYPPDVAEQERFLALQREARNAGRGLWSSAADANGDGSTGCRQCDRNRYNCSDFSNQTEAQACFEYCLTVTGTDIHNLDGGGDGIVCESLP
jgi:endonuclease YncB( thermonuclease family)